jgi:hypothetical protein
MKFGGKSKRERERENKKKKPKQIIYDRFINLKIRYAADEARLLYDQLIAHEIKHA